MRSWRLHWPTGHTFAGLAGRINPIVRGVDAVLMDAVVRCVLLADRTEYALSDVRAGNATDDGTQPCRTLPAGIGGVVGSIGWSRQTAEGSFREPETATCAYVDIDRRS